MKTFRSLKEIKQHYFPGTYEKEQWDKMTPAEKGKHLAEETIKEVRNNVQ